MRKAEAKLRRLYELYGDGGDTCLLEAITAAKKDVDRLNGLIDRERVKGASTQAAMNVYQRLEGIQDAWPFMSVQEQRVILASVVENVTISDGYTDVKLKFGLSA